MSDTHANHPPLPLLLLPILPLPSSSFTCSVFFSFWYTVSNPPPEKERIANPPFPQLIKEVWVLNASPSASRAKTRRRHLFLSLLAKNGGGIETSSLPPLAKRGREFKTPSSHVRGKSRGGLRRPAPLPFWPKRRRNSNNRPPFHLHLLCSFPFPSFPPWTMGLPGALPGPF